LASILLFSSSSIMLKSTTQFNPSSLCRRCPQVLNSICQGLCCLFSITLQHSIESHPSRFASHKTCSFIPCFALLCPPRGHM
jgi:hypothetical protein